jgi:hypothetical protein
MVVPSKHTAAKVAAHKSSELSDEDNPEVHEPSEHERDTEANVNKDNNDVINDRTCESHVSSIHA